VVGIVSYGVYIPIYRLSRDTIAQAWGRASLGGERSVANNDEGSITMAVGAAFECLEGIDRQNIDGLFFATTTSPYVEKQCSALIATAVDLGDEIITGDYTNCLRAGTTTLRSAADAVASGSARMIVETAADCRLGYPRSDFEQLFGDGAAAFIIGDSEVIAAIEARYSIVNEMLDLWRLPKDTFVQTWESRWVRDEGYNANMYKAASEIMKRAGLAAKDFDKVVLSAGPDTRSHRQLAQRLGFDVKTQVQDPMLTTIGNTGVPHPLIGLASALDEAKPGDRILLGAYGDGVDMFILRVTDEIEKVKNRQRVKKYLESKMTIPSYERYLSYRGLLEAVPGEPFRLYPSATVSWRERESAIRCHGSRCKQCGTVAHPIQRVCINCRAKDEFDTVRLSDKRGKVFTFSLDNLAGRSDDPTIVQTVAESELGSARFYCLMTDCIPSEVEVDMPVEMTFRWLYDGAGFHNYYWKCRPIRNGGS